MQISIGSILLRVISAILLVFATYNPSGHSYLAWVGEGFETDLPLKLLAGIALAIVYIIFLRATLRSIGIIGVGLILALIAALIWSLAYYGLISLSIEDQTPLTWIALGAAGVVLGIGLSWSRVRRMLSGQADVDDVDE